MPREPVDSLLDRLPPASAARAARWWLWAAIVRRWLVTLALAAGLVLHELG